MVSPISVVSVIGSLRKLSWNRILFNNFLQQTPSVIHCEEASIMDIPLYNGDLEESAFPESVVLLQEKIRKADGLLFVTPEYNYSIPGVLKNVLDWTSRPPTDIPYKGKPVAIIGASTSYFGSVRAQLHLRQVLHALGSYVMNVPEFFIPKADSLFIDGVLQDEKLVRKIDTFWSRFEEFIRTFAVNK